MTSSYEVFGSRSIDTRDSAWGTSPDDRDSAWGGRDYPPSIGSALPAHYVYGEVVGATYADKATVARVQAFIVGLPPDKQDPAFAALASALAKQGKSGQGVFGPVTRAAVAQFNKLYGWDQGPVIDDGTLEAMKRPDLQSDYAAKQAALDALAAAQKQVEDAARAKVTATTPAAQAQAQAAAQSAQQGAVEVAKKVADLIPDPATRDAAAKLITAATAAVNAKDPAAAEAAAKSAQQSGTMIREAQGHLAAFAVALLAGTVVAGTALALLWPAHRAVGALLGGLLLGPILGGAGYAGYLALAGSKDVQA